MVPILPGYTYWSLTFSFYQQAIAKITQCLMFLMSQRRELNKELYRGLPLVGWLSLPWHILILKIPFVIRRTWCEYWRNLIYVILTWRILRWHIFGVWMKNCRIASFHMFVKTTVINEPTTPSKNGSLLWFWRKKIHWETIYLKENKHVIHRELPLLLTHFTLSFPGI